MNRGDAQRGANRSPEPKAKGTEMRSISAVGLSAGLDFIVDQDSDVLNL